MAELADTRRGDMASVLRDRLRVDWRVGVIAAVALLYLGTRLALLWRFPPFGDESFDAHLSQIVADDPAQRFVALTDGRGPLLTWLGALGIELGVNPLTSVRLVSVLAGAVTLVVVMLIARRLGGDRLALASGAAYAALPIFLVHSVIGVYEPLVTGLIMLALYLQLRLAERPAAGTAALLGAVMAAALLTKESGRFALVLFPATLLVFDWAAPALGRRLLRWLGAAGLALVVTGLGYSVLLLSPLYEQLGEIRAAKNAYHPVGDALENAWTYFEANRHGFQAAIRGYFTLPVIAAGLLGGIVALRARPRLTILLLLWVVLPFGAAMIVSANPYARYLLPALPLCAIFLAAGLVALGDELRQRRRVPAWAAPVAVAVVVSLMVVRDARILASPDTHPYPGLDEWQFVVGAPAGTVSNQVADEIRRRTGDRGARIAYLYRFHWGLSHQLDPRRYKFEQFNPADARQHFFVANSGPIPDLSAFRVVGSWTRPRHGDTTALYERVDRPGS